MEDQHDDPVGVFPIGVAARLKERPAKSFIVEHPNQFRKLRLVTHLVNLVEIGQQLAVAALVDSYGVHARIVKVADLLGHAALLGIFIMRNLIDDGFDLQLSAFVNLVGGTVGGIRLGNRVVFQPVVVAIAIEVVRGIDGGVHVAQLNSWNNFSLGLRRFYCLLCAACCHDA